MNFIKKLHKWEIKVEKKPKIEIAKLMFMVFALAVICGSGLSITLKNIEAKTITRTQEEIKKIEIQRMNKLIETVKLKY